MIRWFKSIYTNLLRVHKEWREEKKAAKQLAKQFDNEIFTDPENPAKWFKRNQE